MKFNFLMLFLFLICGSLYAADYTGKVVDAGDSSPLFGATVQLYNSAQKSVYHDKAKKSGSFTLEGVKNGKYTMKITYVGYETLEQTLNLNNNSKSSLGTFKLKISDVLTDDVVVEAQMPIGEIVEDTSQFNAAAYKVAENAVAEDLVKKIPGVEVSSDGTITAQGETVKKVLVDGKPFFGNDPQMAMKNLPADIIDKVQVYDASSGNAEFSGNTDGETEKALNIITKRDKRSGHFGRVTAGYGTDEKYSGDIFWNIMNEEARISIIGLTNNVNKQNFSIEDIIGAAGGSTGGRRPPRGGLRPSNSNSELAPGGGGFNSISSFLVGQNDGLVTTNSVGVNYSDQYGSVAEITGSYFFNMSDNENKKQTDREYFLEGDSLQLYNQLGEGTSDNYNHRGNLRLQIDVDSSNAFLIEPSVSAQQNEMNTYASTVNQYQNGELINRADNKYKSEYDGMNFSNDITYRHKFANKNRNLSLSFSNSYQDKDGYSMQDATTDYLSQGYTDTLKQKTDLFNKSVGLSGEVRYTEPIFENSQLQFSYNIDNTNSQSDKKANLFDEESNNYSIFDTTLSSNYKSTFTSQKIGGSYKYKKGIVNLSAGLFYQHSELSGEQIFPYASNVDYEMGSLLPTFRLNLKFSQRNRFNLRYRTKVLSPTVTQLQEVVDNSNTLQLSIGNSDLKPQYSNTINARYMQMSNDMTRFFMIMGAVNFRNNYITNSYYTATADTTLYDVSLAAGSQLVRPINVDGYFDSRFMMNYGFPFPLIRSNLNWGVGATFSHTPTVTNGLKNTSNAYALNTNLNIGSNISENLDFNVNAGYTYYITDNSISSSSSNNKYNVVNLNVDLNWTMFWGIFLQASSSNAFFNGANYDSGDYNTNLLNFSIGKKFLAGNAAEIKLTVYDLLNKNKSVSNNTTEYYNEFVTNTQLKQYFLLSFSYNLKKFGSSSNSSDDGMPGPPPGGRYERD